MYVYMYMYMCVYIYIYTCTQYVLMDAIEVHPKLMAWDPGLIFCRNFCGFHHGKQGDQLGATMVHHHSSPTSGLLQAIFQVLKLVHDSDFWGSSKGVNRFGSSLEFVGSPAPVFGPKWIVVLCVWCKLHLGAQQRLQEWLEPWLSTPEVGI